MALAIAVEGRINHARAMRDGHSNMLEGLDFWAPNVNLFRDPRWGRGQETYGEDPFLSARMGVAYVRGMQGDDPNYYLAISTPKHFAVHSGPEPSRHRDNVDVSKHDELDSYLPAFRAAITEGKAGSIMCAYNSVNGEPACANRFLLEDQLRGKWGFTGYVVSDCDAVSDISRNHHYSKTLAEGTAVSVLRGMDNECNTYQKVADDHDYRAYIDAVKQGHMYERDLDRALVRTFTARFKLGMFDAPELVPYSKIADAEFDSAAHRELARKLANESMVLLKNNGALPIAAGKKVLVVGPLAEQTKVLLGNYNGHPSRTVTILEGMQREFGKENVTYMPGSTYLEQRTEAVAAGSFTVDGKNTLKLTYRYQKQGDNSSPNGFFEFDKYTAVDGGEVAQASFAKLPAPPKDAPQGRLVAVEWSGKLNVRESGYYNLGIESIGAGAVLVNGKYVAGTPGWDPTQERLGRLYFEAGKPADIRIFYTLPTKGEKRAEFVWTQPQSDRLAKAVEAAKNADVVVAVVGITSELEGEEMMVDEPGFKGGDRTSIDLPKPEQELVEGVAKAGKPLVLVLTNGSALAVNRESQLANAVLDAFYPGEEGGAAVAETLSGRNNPSGRLPITFYKGVDQLPSFNDYSMRGRTYRYFDGDPLYSFGYGLSYTNFAYSDLKLKSDKLAAGDALEVEVTVANTGKLAGDEVAELYFKFPPEVEGAPKLALRGFDRVRLNPGESRRVVFTLQPRDMGVVTTAGNPIVAPGKYQLFVGGAQPKDAPNGVHADFSVDGSMQLPE